MWHKLKQRISARWLDAYHFTFAHAAALWFGYPSRRLTVVGVTGTNGKSSTAQLIGQLLMACGERVGWTTTDSFRVGDIVTPNDKKMTMLGRAQTHRLLRAMVRAGCRYAVIETSSQGVEQFRHIGISYRLMCVTNLTPEHIEAHGGFEAYREAKVRAVRALVGRDDGVLVVNGNDAHAATFAAVDVARVIAVVRDDQPRVPVLCDETVEATGVRVARDGTTAELDGERVRVPLLGSFSFSNALMAYAAVRELMRDPSCARRALGALTPIPGRLETFVYRGATIMVDYAPEPYALNALYETVALLRPARIVHVTGSAGGGRDVARRAQIGRLAAEHDDVVIVTNEDPYDDNPWQIINDVADGAVAGGMRDGENLFRVLDRREAILRAIGMVRAGDVVLITGKGSEPVMCVAGGRKVPSDDRVFVREAMRQIERMARIKDASTKTSV